MVIESTGKISSISDAISIGRLGATLLLFGITTATEGALPFYQFYFKELAIVNSRAAKNEDHVGKYLEGIAVLQTPCKEGG